MDEKKTEQLEERVKLLEETVLRLQATVNGLLDRLRHLETRPDPESNAGRVGYSIDPWADYRY